MNDSLSAVKNTLENILARLDTLVGPDLPETWVGPEPGRLTDSTTYRGPFPAALALCHLNALDNERAKSVAQRLAQAIIPQKSDGWTFNYYSRGTIAPSGYAYPDDLDVTCTALAGLVALDPTLVGGDGLAHAVRALTALETAPGGPYRTWLVDSAAPAEWQDVDPAVNANIAFMLSLNDVRLDGLDGYLESQAEQEGWVSRYYSSSACTAFFFARALPPEKCTKLKAWLAKRLDARDWEHALDAAWLAAAYLRLGGDHKTAQPAIDALAALRPEELSAAYAYGVDPHIQGVKQWAGSPAVTLAAIAEALNLFIQNPSATERGPAIDRTAAVRAALDARLKAIPDHLAAASKVCDMILTRDKSGHVSGNAHAFWSAMGGTDSGITEQIAHELGAATVLGWAAYAVYDDLLDDEGDLGLLPAANWCLRACLRASAEQLPDHKQPWSDIYRLLDRADAANAWERQHCRFDPNSTADPRGVEDDEMRWADRSMPHALAPLILLGLSGAGANEPAVKATLDFYRHYILARQWLDDAHDWEADLAAGRWTPVTLALMRRVAEPDDPKHPAPDPARRVAWLYWTETIQVACKKVLDHLAEARQALGRNPAIREPADLLHLLEAPERAARQALDERQQTLDFLRTYGQST